MAQGRYVPGRPKSSAIGVPKAQEVSEKLEYFRQFQWFTFGLLRLT